MMEGVNITALQEMLNPAQDDSDSDEEKPTSCYAKLGPGDVGPTKKTSPAPQNTVRDERSGKDIWGSEEVQAGAELDDTLDPRQTPEYDIIYRQSVMTEDMFLGTNKTPGTASCEDMVVKIKLPDTKMADVKLDVKDKFLDCRSPKYKLGLHLPHPVDHKSGKAQWDSNTHTLSVTLRMKREYDFMNF